MTERSFVASLGKTIYPMLLQVGLASPRTAAATQWCVSESWMESALTTIEYLELQEPPMEKLLSMFDLLHLSLATC